MSDDFQAPSDLPPGELEGPALTSSQAEQSDAALELVRLRLLIWKARAFAGAIAYGAGLAVIIIVVHFALTTSELAWKEREVFADKGQAERLSYLIAFLAFKAAAFGAALTTGLLLVKAANKLSGGALDDTHVEPPNSD
jgi:hypothetical protein